MRVLLPLPLLGVLVFCLYGFTTTFEPMDSGTQLTWRLIYGGVGLLCVLVLGISLTASVRADTRERPRLEKKNP